MTMTSPPGPVAGGGAGLAAYAVLVFDDVLRSSTTGAIGLASAGSRIARNNAARWSGRPTSRSGVAELPSERRSTPLTVRVCSTTWIRLRTIRRNRSVSSLQDSSRSEVMATNTSREPSVRTSRYSTSSVVSSSARRRRETRPVGILRDIDWFAVAQAS